MVVLSFTLYNLSPMDFTKEKLQDYLDDGPLFLQSGIHYYKVTSFTSVLHVTHGIRPKKIEWRSYKDQSVSPVNSVLNGADNIEKINRKQFVDAFREARSSLESHLPSEQE